MNRRHLTVFFARCFTSVLILAVSGTASAQSTPKAPTLCIDGAQNCPKETGATGRIKWHPGHYALTQSYGSIPDFVVTDVAGLAAVRGVAQRYNWSQLEPAKGQYDFSAIRADLNKLRPHGKLLIPQIMDRSWGKSTSTASLPAYLATLPGAEGGWTIRPDKGVIANVWLAPVMDRLIALSAAMAAEFDDEPLLEAITFDEITTGLTPGTTAAPAHLSNDAMILQWKRLATAAAGQWKRTAVYFQTNFLGGVTGPLEIVEHAYQLGTIGVGGPDVLPPGAHDYQVAGDRVIMRSPNTAKGDNPAKFIRDYRGALAICFSVQTPELGGKEGAFMPAEFADYIIPQVGATHITWVVAPSTLEINWANHIRPYLAKSPRATIQTCPTRFAAGCDTN